MKSLFFLLSLLVIVLLQLSQVHLVFASSKTNAEFVVVNAHPDEDPVARFKNVSQVIISTAVASTNVSKLEYLCDTFGPRYRGLPNDPLNSAIDWIVETMNQEGLANVRKDTVDNIMNWQRNEEWARVVSPRAHNMSILGLGTSVGTGGVPITAEAIVVFSFDDLQSKADAGLTQGKIVVFDTPFINYETTVVYRAFGASYAAAAGAVAMLVRSITPFSLYTPHTGGQRYQDNGFEKIPCAAITVEDAEMLTRWQVRGQPLVISLFMGADVGTNVTSYNILAELEGSTHPEEIVLIGGHVDSWDVGQGAMDDGGGIFTAWESLRILTNLVNAGQIPRPRRTIRVVMWVDEELEQQGAKAYVREHLEELPNHVIAIESDSGNFQLLGFGFTGTQEAYKTMVSIGDHLLSDLGSGNMTYGDGAEEDNGFLGPYGVPLGSLTSAGNGNFLEGFYFFYHHTNADTITSLDFDGLAQCAAGFAVVSYVLADMEQRLPFGNGTDIYYSPPY